MPRKEKKCVSFWLDWGRTISSSLTAEKPMAGKDGNCCGIPWLLIEVVGAVPLGQLSEKFFRELFLQAPHIFKVQRKA